MIVGLVNDDLEAVVTVPVSSLAGQVHDVEAVVDSGFNGLLTLPPPLVEELRLPQIGSSTAILANGAEDVCNVHEATVLWDGHPKRVRVDATDTTPLVGMELLEGHSLHIDVHRGGLVLVEPDRAA